MWVKISENNCINLGLAARVVVQESRASGPTAGGRAPAKDAVRFDVEAHFPDERKYSLASFPVRPDCGHHEAEAKAGEVFARIMRAAGDGQALLDLTKPVDSRPGAPAANRGAADGSPIRFAL